MNRLFHPSPRALLHPLYRRAKKGSLFVELLLTLAIMAIIIQPVYTMIVTSFGYTKKSIFELKDIELAACVIDQVRSLPSELLKDINETFTSSTEAFIPLRDGRNIPLKLPNLADDATLTLVIESKSDDSFIRRIAVKVSHSKWKVRSTFLVALSCPN